MSKTRDATGGAERPKLLKELMASAVIVAFTPRKKGGDAQAVHTPSAPPVAPPMPPPVPSPRPPDQWPSLTPIEAAKVFYLEMQAHAAGEALQWKWVRHSYDVLAAERGWPALSDKALGMHLVSFGCQKKSVDLRRKGQGRTSAYAFPLATSAQKRRRRK